MRGSPLATAELYHSPMQATPFGVIRERHPSANEQSRHLREKTVGLNSLNRRNHHSAILNDSTLLLSCPIIGI